jgi:U3 small nucleolar RNA-associated protein 22
MAEQPSQSLRIAHSVAHTLRQGLSDRAFIVHVSVPDSAHLQIGLVFSPTQANRVLDVGPSSEKTTAGEAFRALWGNKAELRRFKDGSIAESVVWPISRPEDAALIPSHIVKWLLLRHFAIAASDVHVRYAGEEWLAITQIPASARDAVCVQGAEKQGFAPINKAYDELYRLLKSIDTELPLAILNVVPADEALRYSSPFIPHPIDVARSASAPDCLRYVPSAEVVLQFESSPRWPDDLGAIQKVKLAIFEKLARVILDKVKHARAEIVFDHAVIATQSEIEDQAGLEVLMPNGTAFTLRIHHEKERTHLERIIEGDAPAFGTSLPLPPRRLAIPALAHYMTRFVHRPAHHAAVQPLHSRFPSYSSATRLLKRWIAAHMLSLHVPSEAVELIMASVYLDSGSTTPPASAGSGFTRAVQRLASWQYDEQPLVVPLVSATHDASFAKGATEQEIMLSQSGRTRFPLVMRKEAEDMFAQRHQQTGKASGAAKGNVHAYAEGKGAWTIVTEQDLSGRRWTATMPSRVVASRVRQLAGATLVELTSGQPLLSVKVSLTALYSMSGY